MISIFLRVLAGRAGGVVVLLTLGPVGLRPQFGHPEVERFSAYVVVAAAWVVAYPRHWRWVALGLVAAAIGLEVGQLFIPGRDGGLADAGAKVAGVFAGLLVGTGLNVGAKRS
jgi:hypothetical protein